MEKIVLGVKIDDISLEKALTIISDWLTHRKKVQKIVVTPGPEFLITAKGDPTFKKILNSADLSVNDSFGLQLSCGFRNRVPGIDLMLALCQLAEEKKWSVGLFGGATGVAKKTKEKLLEKFPGLKISFTVDGLTADKIMNDYDIHNNNNNQYDSDILFVNLGHPKQEKFLAAKKIPFRVGIGVGGSFDLISGVLPRAPKIFRLVGLEWLWRALTKPGHFRRGLRATFGFWWTLLTT